MRTVRSGAPLSLCMHAHCYCAIYSEGVHARFSACGCMHVSSLQYVTNLVFETFVYLLILTVAVILSPFPLPIPSTTTLGQNIPRVLFPSSRQLGGDSLPRSAGAKLMIGARQRQCGSADFVCLRAHCYLHHGLPRSDHWPRTLTTPLHATTLHSHLLPTHILVPHSHLYFGYKTACPARTAGPRLSIR